MNLIWFRRDLRSIDNTALHYALQDGSPVLAVYIATPEQWLQHGQAPIQTDLIQRRLHELQRQLNALNIKLLYREVENYPQCAQQIVDICERYAIEHVMVNKEYEVNEVARDELVQQQLHTTQAQLHRFDDKCVQAPRSILNQKGEYYKVFTPFKKAWLAAFLYPQIKPTLQSPTYTLLAKETEWTPQSTLNAPLKCSKAWPVSDDEILQRLNTYCAEDVNRYAAERDFPHLDATSRLSAYLAIGALSVRQCIVSLYLNQGDAHSEGAQIWLSELIWREFYQHLLVFEPKLSKRAPFVEWTDNIRWHNDAHYLSAWQQGQTGFPIIDAAMRQLNQTGWMHNRLRMVVASFLTKDLHCDWRLGEAYFMQQLIDGDYAANNGGWQWSASTGCDGQPYFRIFNPVSQSEKFDPKGEFLRYWLPELNAVPDKYVHKPWLWSEALDLDYPQPIVDHSKERIIALESYKQAKG